MAGAQKSNDKGLLFIIFPSLSMSLCSGVLCIPQWNQESLPAFRLWLRRFTLYFFPNVFALYLLQWTGCSSGSLFLFGLSHTGCLLGEILQRGCRRRQEKVKWMPSTELLHVSMLNECRIVLMYNANTIKRDYGVDLALQLPRWRSVLYFMSFGKRHCDFLLARANATMQRVDDPSCRSTFWL